MSLVNAEDGRAVHFPKQTDKFSFDAEVSAIFPDMALRSIPLFYQTHELHAKLCAKWIEQEQVHILDVGASRGAFLAALEAQYLMYSRRGIHVTACDISPDMCSKLREDFPWVQVIEGDITAHELRPQSWDIINCTYVLQFVKPEQQVNTLLRLARALKPGGVLFMGQKMSHFGPAGRMLHEQYIQFRIDNGYTREEIEAKTKALAASMHPMPDNVLRDYLNNFGLEVMETSRWTVFNNYMCTKGL